jgi:hypothetical protein
MFHSSPTSKIWHTSTYYDVRYDGAKPQSCVVENFCTTGGQRSAVPAGHSRKNFSLNFKLYNLTIRVVNFCETFWTCSCNSLGQDLKVKMKKNEIKISRAS